LQQTGDLFRQTSSESVQLLFTTDNVKAGFGFNPIDATL